MHPKNFIYTQKRTAIICIVFLAAFVLFTVFRPSFYAIDIAVNLWMPTIQSPTPTVFAILIAIVFDTPGLVLMSIVISAMLFLKNHKQYSLLLLGAMGGDALIVTIMKNISLVARPTNAIFTGNGFSYPSGHSAGIVVFAGILAFFAWRHWRSSRVRVGIGMGLGVLIGVVGFDRVYLNVHWFSDVIGGWLFGAFWLSFIILIFVWLEYQGSFQSDRFDGIANWLYVVAVVVAVLVVLSGFIV